MKTVRLRQIYTDVDMRFYRGVDSLRTFLINKDLSWTSEDVFLFRNKNMRIMIAFAPSSNGLYYERLPKNESWDFSVRTRHNIFAHFGKALGLRWDAANNIFKQIETEDKKREDSHAVNGTNAKRASNR